MKLFLEVWYKSDLKPHTTLKKFGCFAYTGALNHFLFGHTGHLILVANHHISYHRTHSPLRENYLFDNLEFLAVPTIKKFSWVSYRYRVLLLRVSIDSR